MGDRVSGRVLRRLDEAVRYGPWMTARSWEGLRGMVTVLLYHRIAPHEDHSWLEAGGIPVTPPSIFRRQLRWLRRLGAVFLTFEDLLQGRFAAPSEVGVIVCFDDGFADALGEGRRILEEEGIRAVYFVTSEMILPARPLWEHRAFRLAADPDGRASLLRHARGRLGALEDRELLWALKSLAEPRSCEAILEAAEGECPALSIDVASLYPSAEGIREARTRGHEIGAHGASHRMRHTLSAQEFRAEAVGSKEALETLLREPVHSFSYPFNDWLFGDEEVCRAAGFDVVATVHGGRLSTKDGLTRVPRRTVHRLHDRSSAFRKLVCNEIGPVGPAPSNSR